MAQSLWGPQLVSYLRERPLPNTVDVALSVYMWRYMKVIHNLLLNVHGPLPMRRPALGARRGAFSVRQTCMATVPLY